MSWYGLQQAGTLHVGNRLAVLPYQNYIAYLYSVCSTLMCRAHACSVLHKRTVQLLHNQISVRLKAVLVMHIHFNPAVVKKCIIKPPCESFIKIGA